MKRNISDIDLRNFNLDIVGVDSPEIKQSDGKKKLKSKISLTPKAEDTQLLQTAFHYWAALYDFRDRRKRSRMYYRGDQWGEYMDNPDNPSETITEEEHIVNQGKVPLKQNIIRQVVRNMLGQYLSNPSDTTVVSHDRKKAHDAEILTNAIRSVHNINRTDQLDTRLMEEFLLSGAVVQKVGYRFFKERNTEDVMLNNVNPNRIFFNTDLNDPRMWDLRIIGQLYDLTIDEVISSFAKTPDDAQALRMIYAGSNIPPIPSAKGLSPDEIDSTDFYLPYDPTMCRVIEVWYLKSAWRVYAHDLMDGSYNIYPASYKGEIERINQERLQMAAINGMPPEKVPLVEYRMKYEQFWYGKYMSSWGHVLWEGETPFMHEEHPFIIALYPLLDGEVWGFVEDIIDQQRYINRLITLMDFIIGFSAKGVLLVPEDSIPDGMTLDDFAEEWTKFNGVIKIKLKPGQQLPAQITGKAANNGINEMLMLQLRLLQDISGVNPAIQGQQAKSGTAASLYMQETENASLNSKDYMQTFNDFKRNRDMKVLKMIKQYYKDQRYIHISGGVFKDQNEVYDPDRVRDLEVEVVVSEGTNTPVYRQVTDNTLFELLRMQAINVEMFLENSSLPFADRLLEQINQLKQQAMQQQMGAGMMNPEMAQMAGAAQQQLAQGIDPNSMAIINQLMSQQG